MDMCKANPNAARVAAGVRGPEPRRHRSDPRWVPAVQGRRPSVPRRVRLRRDDRLSRLVTKGGTYTSPLEALEFWNNIGRLFEAPDPEPEEFLRNGERLVVLGRFRGRSRATGQEVAVRFAHAYGLTDAERPMSEQKYKSFELIIDTAPVLAALAEQDR